jgi:HAD superfamily phosphoserine phosphatase-like hydrolase
MHDKALILDIDGTICPEVSWLTLTREMGASVARHEHVFERFQAGQLPYAEAKRQLIELWASTGRANARDIAAIFNAIPIRPEVEPLISEARRQGYEVCLITGSVDLYTETIARRIGVTHYFANTRLHFDSAGSLVDMDYELDQGALKLKQLSQFCKAQSIRPTDCLVVGDGESELELFQATVHGILLRRPDHSRQLMASAWKIVPHLGDAQKYLLMIGVLAMSLAQYAVNSRAA